AQIVITDPKALKHVAEDLGKVAEKVKTSADPYAAARDADAIILLTDWEEYKTLDYKRLYAEMRKPAFIFDYRNILPHAQLRKLGFQVKALGK
ncbi:MAG TPA: nucleotide sugar dehydrogenase, partial [Elusimicrobia bacterium]|nr:nucleotide sugar dehydrogenase [Elusimicrobiota bacterium]